MKPKKIHYIHSLSYSAKDKLAGAFVLIILLFVIGLFLSKVNVAKFFDSVINYQSVIKDAQGISVETAVYISGIDVGRVYDIYLSKNNEVTIKFFIYERFQPLVRGDSTAEVSKLSLVGDNVIIIKAGSSNQPMLADNATIQIKEHESLDFTEIIPTVKRFTSIMSKLTEVIDDLDSQTIRASGEELQTILTDVSKISHQIAEGKGTVGRIIYDKNQEKQIANSLVLIEKALSGIAKRIDEVQPIIANANQLATESKIIVKNAAKLSMESQQMLVDTRKSVNKVNQLLNDLPELVNNTQEVLQAAEDTLEGSKPIHVMVDNFSLNPNSVDNKLLIEDAGLDE